MSELYTCGTWTVAPGREDDFVAAWQDLADWTLEAMPGARWAQLVQDTERPNVFLSFGPWESDEAIAAWRESAGFQERVGRIRALLEGFEPGIWRLRASVGR
jgi:heme-degrading monooxygenase HmoA